MAHKSRRTQVLSDGRVQALYDFAVRDPNDEQGLRGDWWDRGMPGLLLRIGKRDLSWCFLRHRRVHGKRHVIHRRGVDLPWQQCVWSGKADLLRALSNDGNRSMLGRVRAPADLRKGDQPLPLRRRGNGEP
jgi:hypothetical protein